MYSSKVIVTLPASTSDFSSLVRGTIASDADHTVLSIIHINGLNMILQIIQL